LIGVEMMSSFIIYELGKHSDTGHGKQFRRHEEDETSEIAASRRPFLGETRGSDNDQTAYSLRAEKPTARMPTISLKGPDSNSSM